MEESATQLLESTGSSRKCGNQLEGPAAATRTGTFGRVELRQNPPAAPFRSRLWVYGAVAAGIALFLLALYLRLQLRRRRIRGRLRPDACSTTSRTAGSSFRVDRRNPFRQRWHQTLYDESRSGARHFEHQRFIRSRCRWFRHHNPSQPRQRFRRKALPMCQRLYLQRNAWRPSFDSLVSFTLSRVLLADLELARSVCVGELRIQTARP